ncbi:MAG: hypothetical protein WC654_05450 [Patescibacteria group bacterium]
MSDILDDPERPEILLTIFHLVRDSYNPMTREEIVSLVLDCDASVDPDELFRHWRELGHLRERRGRYYVLDELGKRLEHTGTVPLLGSVERNGWIMDNTRTGFW